MYDFHVSFLLVEAGGLLVGSSRRPPWRHLGVNHRGLLETLISAPRIPAVRHSGVMISRTKLQESTIAALAGLSKEERRMMEEEEEDKGEEEED